MHCRKGPTVAAVPRSQSCKVGSPWAVSRGTTLIELVVYLGFFAFTITALLAAERFARQSSIHEIALVEITHGAARFFNALERDVISATTIDMGPGIQEQGELFFDIPASTLEGKPLPDPDRVRYSVRQNGRLHRIATPANGSGRRASDDLVASNVDDLIVSLEADGRLVTVRITMRYRMGREVLVARSYTRTLAPRRTR